MLTYTYCLPAIANVLKVIKLNKPITPAEINKADGSRNYAAKYVMLMRKYYGFTFTIQKEGRTVVSYTCTAMPENIKELRDYKTKTKTKTKEVPAKKLLKEVGLKPVIVSTIGEERRRIKAAEIKAKNLETMKKVSAKKKVVKQIEEDMVLDVPQATSFAVDPEWDSIDNVMNFLKG